MVFIGLTRVRFKLLGNSVLSLLVILLDLVLSDFLCFSLPHNLNMSRVLADVGMGFSPHLLKISRTFSCFNIACELLLVFVRVGLLKKSHVLSNVSTIDVPSQLLG